MIVGYCLLSYCGVITFTIWDQVSVYIQDQPWAFLTRTVSIELLTTNPHVLRSLVPLPMLLIAEYFSLSSDAVFSLYCALCICIAGMSVNWAYCSHQNVKRSPWEIPVLLFFMAISLFMNGRMCFGLAGSGILLATHTGYIAGRVSRLRTNLGNTIGIYLLLVSTGALYVGTMMYFTWLFYSTFFWYHQKKSWRDSILLHWVVTLGFMVFVFHAILVFWRKLENWDEGEHIRIVEHGAAGRVWQIISNPLAMAVVLLGVLAFQSYRARAIKGDPAMTYLLTCFPMGLVMGMFGYSTLATNLPLFSLLGILTFTRTRKPRMPAIAGRIPH